MRSTRAVALAILALPPGLAAQTPEFPAAAEKAAAPPPTLAAPPDASTPLPATPLNRDPLELLARSGADLAEVPLALSTYVFDSTR